jgi:putative PIN family toxin of toxin-antitoxin system
MNVLLDTNVYVSYLLSREATSTVNTVVRTCLLQGEVQLFVPQEVIDELREISGRPKLKKVLPFDVIQRLVIQLQTLTIIVPPVAKPAAYARDHKDDYLVVQSLLHRVDYLISGDLDLLTLGAVESLKIVSPARFLDILQQAEMIQR